MQDDPHSGRLLRSLMDRYYVAPIDVARALGVAPSTVVRWTRGELAPTSEDLIGLRRIFGAEAAEMVAAQEHQGRSS